MNDDNLDPIEDESEGGREPDRPEAASPEPAAEHAPPRRLPETGKAASPGARRLGAPLRLLYRSNPFYLVSAGLLLYGLNAIFRMSEETTNAWMLLGALASYTTLLAVTGCLIVRYGKVWDDARSILLIVLVLLLATSVGFDELAIKNPSQGIQLLAVGLVIAVAIVEGLRRSIGIRLGPLFTAPLLVILSLFFVYPLALILLLKYGDAANRPAFSWGIFLFPTIAAAVFLTLIPAIRKGCRYVQHNGTPWRWPWFPWTVFGLLAAAVIVRSYYLALSFHWVPGMDSPFGLYFLVPFMLAFGVLLLEIGVKERRLVLQRIALGIPFLALLFSFPGKSPNPEQAEFLGLYMSSFGTPVFMAIVGGAVFYAYAWLRRGRVPELGFAVTMLLGSLVNGETVGLSTLNAPQMAPLLGLAVLELWMAMRTRATWRWVFFGVLLSYTTGRCLMWLLGTFLSTRASYVVLAHVAYLAMLAVALLCRDRLAKVLQAVGALLLVGFAGSALFLTRWYGPGLPSYASLLYTGCLFIFAILYGRLSRNRLYAVTVPVNLALCLLRLGGSAHGWISDPHLPPGVRAIFWSGVCFLIAAVISLAKGGLLRKVGRILPH